MTRLVAVITSIGSGLPAQLSRAGEAGADLVEIRADLIGSLEATLDAVAIVDRPPILYTLRESTEGGQWSGTDDAKLVALERFICAANARRRREADWIDVELAVWQRNAALRERVCELIRLSPSSDAQDETHRSVRLVLSAHFVAGRPADLSEHIDELLATPADVCKVAWAGEDALDGLEALTLQARLSNRFAVIAMGESAIVSRLAAPKFGAALGYATLDGSEKSAAGQCSISELVSLYRWRDVRPQTRLYGVIGWPLAHTRSPAIHNAAMRVDGIDGLYVPLPVRPENLDAFFDFVVSHPSLDFRGFSITTPHKAAVAAITDRVRTELSPAARGSGVINTLSRTASGWRADNTDALALKHLLADIDFARRRAVVLGAGGAAAAVVWQLREMGIEVTVFNRTPERARQLAMRFACDWAPWDARHSATSDLWIQCTSIGAGADDASPIDVDKLPGRSTIIDLAYSQGETDLVRAARARGLRVVDGVKFLLAQAAHQYRIWHAREMPALQTDILTSTTIAHHHEAQ